jgi:hypothetical protein
MENSRRGAEIRRPVERRGIDCRQITISRPSFHLDGAIVQTLQKLYRLHFQRVILDISTDVDPQMIFLVRRL